MDQRIGNAFDMDTGIVSPGGVGYDINCGVRLLRSDLNAVDVKGLIPELVNALFRNIPFGVGSQRKDLKLSGKQLDNVLAKGAKWAMSQGYGNTEELRHIEEGGCIPGGKPEYVSEKACKRGKPQLGTLGSGNHFVEVGFVEEVFDEEESPVLGSDELEAVPPEAWEAARLRPIAAFRLLAFKHMVVPNLVAFHDDRPSPSPRPRASWLALYRRDYSVLRLELSRAEHDLLRAIVDGAPLGDALATAATSKSPRQQAKVFRWFRTWISEGLFTAIES